MIFNGLIVQQGSGSAGGLVVSHNKGGMYIRARRVPVNPDSTRQTSTRSFLSQFATKWTSVLDATQRNEWNQYASSHPITNAIGASVYITGLAWYVKCNSVLIDAALTPITDPPDIVAPNALTTLVVTFSSAILFSAAFTPALDSTKCLQAWMTIPGSQGQTPNFRQARLTGYSNCNEASPWLGVPSQYCQINQQTTFFFRVMNTHGLFSALKSHTTIRTV